ncbi:MAG: rhomboid family intramembrane serine protease [Candidatus Bathyarchaeia archaeon]
MLPLKDLNRPLTAPHVNRMLLIANIIIFLIYWLSVEEIFFPAKIAEQIEAKFIMIPQQIMRGQRLYTLITSMFMHANWLHLIGNMLFLYIFGDNVEDVFSHGGYFAFYIICGLIAAFFHIISMCIGLAPQGFNAGVVGASGAVSGVLGAYFVLYPKARLLAWVFYFVLPIPALIFLGFWFLMQWFYGFFNIYSGVAYWAHIGGFITGMILALTFGLKRKKARYSKLRL